MIHKLYKLLLAHGLASSHARANEVFMDYAYGKVLNAKETFILEKILLPGD